MEDHKQQKVNYCYDKEELVVVRRVGGELGMELVDTEESISLPKASFKPITVLGKGEGEGGSMV